MHLVDLYWYEWALLFVLVAFIVETRFEVREIRKWEAQRYAAEVRERADQA